MVYEGVEGKTNYSQVYVLLVILLLFSQDDVFNDSIQKIVRYSSNDLARLQRFLKSKVR